MLPSYDSTYPLYPVLSFTGFLLSLVPLWWHLQAWNSGTCAYMIWTAFSCLSGFVNSIVWHNNIQNHAPVWCDISSKLMIGVSIGIPASILCISRRLYCITSIKTVSITQRDKKRMVATDICIAAGIPVLVMILHYIVQGHRFDILQDIGCYPVVFNTPLAYGLYFMWPVVLGFGSFVYSAMTLRSFWIRRAQFFQLMNSASGMSPSRYLRLVMLAIIDMLLTIPIGIYTIYQSSSAGLSPWVSWQDTHFHFSRVEGYPSFLWRSQRNFEISVEVTRWLPVLCAFLFFALFGFASEARRTYSTLLSSALIAIGFRHRFVPKPDQAALPSWIKPLKLSSPSFGAQPPIYSKNATPLAKSKSSSQGLLPALHDTNGRLSLPLHLHFNANTNTHERRYPTSSPASLGESIPSSPASITTTALGSIEDEGSSPPRQSNFSPAVSLLSMDQQTSDLSHSSPGAVQSAGSPGYHRPFSPPLPYPATAPHPSSAAHVDGIFVTVHTFSQTSSESLRP